MDPRIREQAQVLIEHSTRVEQGDNVVIVAPSVAADLVVALHELIGDKGAHPFYMASDSRAARAYLRASDPEDFETPSHVMALFKEMDVYISVRTEVNATETSDVAPEVLAAHSLAMSPTLEERLSKRWVATQFPGTGSAQLAEMSLEGYENFVWDAINKDWDAQRTHQQQLVEILNPASEIRIVSGDTTDITMGLENMITINDSGMHNMPGGEVFTAPVPDSVEGEVLFDLPLYHQGREVTGAWLKFEDGKVIEHSAEKNEDVLTNILNTDAGARRLGELGIGMNRDIDQFTYNMLFDEKMGDTVHMAVGRAYDECVGEGAEQNQSATHVDMIVDMAEDSVIEVDGEVIQRNGTFSFEDGFEG